MKRILTYGTFDLFHYGHLKILERARQLGDYLVVAVSTDKFNAVKGKTCVYPYDHRAQIVEAIKYVDISVLEGFRDEATQNDYYRRGMSKLKFPQGKHNVYPSLAVDIAPYPIVWTDMKRFRSVAFFIKGIAISMGIKVRLGIDWNDNFKGDESFIDGPHIELVSKLIDGEWIDYK